MKNLFRRSLPIAALLAFSAVAAYAGTNGAAPQKAESTNSASSKPLASPAAMATTKLKGADLTIHYNSPAMRGRVIMGGLVPYGKVWRTGANPATSFVTTGDVKVGTLNVPAGKYTIYTLPAAPGTPWQLIINRQTGQWGTVYNANMDLGRTPMQYKKLSAPQESMTIDFESTTKTSTELHVKWETTDVSVKIQTAK